MLKPIVISAPFGNYFSYPGATSTLGTYTLRSRGGPLKRLWRCALTLRYSRKAGGWVNRLGLPNPGVDALPVDAPLATRAVSIHGFDAEEWRKLAVACVVRLSTPAAVELNLSCPNVKHRAVVSDVTAAVAYLREREVPVVAKLPPVRWMEFVRPLYDLGVRHFHCFNTIPVPGGGLSGKALRQFVLWGTEEIKSAYPGAVVIAGGGVTGLQDVRDYVSAGADHVAVGSALLNPFRWRTVRRLTECRVDPVKRVVYFEE